MAANSGAQRSTSAEEPPGTIQSCLAAAASGRPNTGAATKPMPALLWASSSWRQSATEMVLEPM